MPLEQGHFLKFRNQGEDMNKIMQAIFGLPTVQGVVAEFSKAIAGLESVAQKQSVEATRQQRKASAALAAAEVAANEAKQAEAVKAKLQALLA
jgi:hypothetical protein